MLVASFVHEHAIFEEHAVGEPPHEESDWEDDEVLPVLPGDDRDEDPHEGHVEESSLRVRIPHCYTSFCFFFSNFLRVDLLGSF